MPPLPRPLCLFTCTRFFSFLSTRPKETGWQKFARENEKLHQALRLAEEKYHHEVKLRLEDKLGGVQAELLRLRNNFNLRGALEYSLREYRTTYKVPDTAQAKVLQHLLKDGAYQACLETTSRHYQLRAEDINACANVLYHELSKHAHGNTAELVVSEAEHTITEVAAIEAVFCALKSKGCFSLPLKFSVRNQERFL